MFMRSEIQCLLSLLLIVVYNGQGSHAFCRNGVHSQQHAVQINTYDSRHSVTCQRAASIHSASFIETKSDENGFCSDSTSLPVMTHNDNNNSENENDDDTYERNLEIARLATECAISRNVTAAQQALRILRAMETPDTVAYNSVLKALAKLSPGRIGTMSAAKQAYILLQEMIELYKRQNQANNDWYDRLPELDQDTIAQGPPAIRVKPNVRSYSTVIDAFGRCGNVESAQMAEKLLNDLMDRYEQTQDGALEPNLITYNSVLTAWAKAGSVSRCLDILESMPIAPDVISYNAALHAIARSGHPNAGEQAEHLLRTMNVIPNARSFTTCMDAYSQSGRADKAYELLKEVVDIYKKTGDENWRPNCISFSTVIHAYALTRQKDKAQKAYHVFQEMKELGIEPNRVTYNNLLNCCATSAAQPELIDMVETLYEQVKKTKNPDHFTFGTVLKACSNLLWKDQDFAPAVFREACARGQVSSGVLWQFRQAVPIETYREFVHSDSVHWTDLPQEWRRNLKENSRRRIRNQ